MIAICATCRHWSFERSADVGQVGRCNLNAVVSVSWHTCKDHEKEDHPMDAKEDEEKRRLIVPILDKRVIDLRVAKRKHEIAVPNGQRLIYVVRKGMEIDPNNTERAAKLVGISIRTYQFVRRLLVIKDMNVLNHDEEIILDDLIADLDENKKIKPVVKRAQPLIDKYWRKHTVNGIASGRKDPRAKRSKKERTRLENTLFAIREACSNNDEMAVPILTNDERKEALDLLVESMASLWNLFYRIRGETNV